MINNLNSLSLGQHSPFQITSDYPYSEVYETWSRPPHWPVLPTVLPTEQKVVGLYIVFPNQINTIEMVITNELECLVEWGDGSSTLYGGFYPGEGNQTSIKSHTYDYNTISGSIFYDPVPGSLGHTGYKLIIVTVNFLPGHPKWPTNYFTFFSTGFKNNKFLELVISGVELTGVQLNAFPTSCSYLEQASILSSAIADASYLFKNCFYLKSVPVLNLPMARSALNMFENCFKLVSIGEFTFKLCTNFSGMFTNCFDLKHVRWFNTWSTLFWPKVWPPYSEGDIYNNFSKMFYCCTKLETVPLFITVQGNNFTSMFAGCESLVTIPLLNCSHGTAFNSMFGKGTFPNSTINLICFNLTEVPTLNTSKGITFNSMFQSCISLIYSPILNVSSATDLSSIFDTCSWLERGSLIGIQVNISYNLCDLGYNELNDIYTYLSANASGRTITVTNNRGTISDNPLIAVNKGWTVTGS